MAEEKKPKKDQEKSTLGERMSDISGIRILQDGKWVSASEIVKQKKEADALAKKKPVTASSYVDSILMSSGGAGAPAEVLDMGRIKKGKYLSVTADADYGDECPPATQDIVLNIKNRQVAIDDVGYGPLNPDEPNEEFWQEKADRWKTTPVEASKSICGNCVFFDRRPKTLDCIETGLAEGGSGEQSAWDSIDQAELGYCTALDFKCAASRTCNAWAAGGPITEDVKQKPIAAGALVPEEQKLAEALIEVVDMYGKFNSDNTGVWAGYDSAKKNAENAKIGVKCGNCVFWNAPNGCDIISHETEEGGLCRFAILPDGAVTPEKVFSKAPNLIQDELKKKIDGMGDNYTEESINISDLTPTQDYLDSAKLKGAGDNTNLITVYLDEEGFKLVDGHHRCAHKVGSGKGNIMAKVYRGPLVATAGSKPAPKKDQIKGSDRNKKGSAATGRKVTFSKAVEKSLKDKVESHNKSISADGKKVTLSMLKAVYRRGAGAFSSSHRPDQNRNSWAMGRVNAYLRLVKSGKPDNAKYTTDNDLLPKSHPKSTRASVLASALEDDYESELSIVLLPETEYTSKEHALVALAEFSGMGYEVIPALQAAWIRAERADESPFDRAKELAVSPLESRDADLLPKEF